MCSFRQLCYVCCEGDFRIFLEVRCDVIDSLLRDIKSDGVENVSKTGKKMFSDISNTNDTNDNVTVGDNIDRRRKDFSSFFISETAEIS